MGSCVTLLGSCCSAGSFVCTETSSPLARASSPIAACCVGIKCPLWAIGSLLAHGPVHEPVLILAIDAIRVRAATEEGHGRWRGGLYIDAAICGAWRSIWDHDTGFILLAVVLYCMGLGLREARLLYLCCLCVGHLGKRALQIAPGMFLCN